MPCALFAARHTHADKVDAGAVQRRTAPPGVVEIGVATVNDRVAVGQQWRDRVDHHIHRLGRGDHEQDGARGRNRSDEICQVGVACDRAA